MTDLGQRARGHAPHLRGRAVGANEVRERRLQRAILAYQRVERGVGDLRRVLVMVAAIVVRDLVGERGEADGGLGFGLLGHQARTPQKP